MLRRTALIALLSAAVAGAVIIDRIAVTVGKHAVKLSDINRDLRVTEFLNREPLNVSADAKRKSAQRLVDQTIIGTEIANGGYTRPTNADVDAFLNQLRHDRFGGSDARLRQALVPYGLTEDQLRAELLWQLEVLRFFDQRFRAGVLVTDDEVKAYYDQHRADLAREYPQLKTFDALAPKIRESLEGERVNQNFVQWLDRAHQRNQIEYRQEAFQ